MIFSVVDDLSFWDFDLVCTTNDVKLSTPIREKQDAFWSTVDYSAID